MEIYFMEHWYTSKEIRSILKISNQYLYLIILAKELNTSNNIYIKIIINRFCLIRLFLFDIEKHKYL